MYNIVNFSISPADEINTFIYSGFVLSKYFVSEDRENYFAINILYKARTFKYLFIYISNLENSICPFTGAQQSKKKIKVIQSAPCNST